MAGAGWWLVSFVARDPLAGLVMLVLVGPLMADMAWMGLAGARAMDSDLAGQDALTAAGWDGPVGVVSGVASTGGGLLPRWLGVVTAAADEAGVALRLAARNQVVADLYERGGFGPVPGVPLAMIRFPGSGDQ